MKAKTDELAAEREAKEISEAVKNLDVLAEKSKEENQDIRALMFENLKELKEFYVICKLENLSQQPCSHALPDLFCLF